MGLVLDSLRQKLYYTDEGEDAKIAEISTDGSRHRVVLRLSAMKPRALVLHDQSRSVHCTAYKPPIGNDAQLV